VGQFEDRADVIAKAPQAFDVRLGILVPLRLELCDGPFKGHERTAQPTPSELVKRGHHAAVFA